MITLNTKLNELNFSSETESFWNNTLAAKYNQSYEGYSPFMKGNKLPKIEKLKSDGCRVVELYKNLSDFYKNELYDIKENKATENSFLSLKMLNILKKENLELTTILLNNHKEDNENTGGWRYSEFIDMYLNYLSENKKEIPLFLKDQFLLEAREDKRFSSFHNVDKDIETYFNLLNVMNSKEITNQFFKENLELYCSMVNDDTRELENYARSLNFDSQKRIYEYVNTFLPENSSEYTEYFQDLLPTPVFKTQRLYQSSIEINLYQIMFENGLNQKSSQHLNNIIKECLNVVSSDNFLRLINEDIKVFNTSVKEKAAGLKLNFSTETYEDLEKFEKIILKSLKGVVKVQDKIKLRWTDSFYGEDQLLTNMDAKFILQQYLYETLNEDLKKNETKPRKNKV